MYLHYQVGVFFGGLPIQKDEEVLKNVCPHIVVGTPGRILALVRNKKLNLKHLKHFILDECDKMLELLGIYKYSSFFMYDYNPVEYKLYTYIYFQTCAGTYRKYLEALHTANKS